VYVISCYFGSIRRKSSPLNEKIHSTANFFSLKPFSIATALWCCSTMSLTWIPCKHMFFIACQSGANSASWKGAIPAGRNTPKQVAEIAQLRLKDFLVRLWVYVDSTYAYVMQIL
jgi:hypothetical protein